MASKNIQSESNVEFEIQNSQQHHLDSMVLNNAMLLQQQAAKLEMIAANEEKDRLILQHKMQISKMQVSLDQHEQIRIVQQEQILQLKGNMRVFCRVKNNDDDK